MPVCHYLRAAAVVVNIPRLLDFINHAKSPRLSIKSVNMLRSHFPIKQRWSIAPIFELEILMQRVRLVMTALWASTPCFYTVGKVVNDWRMLWSFHPVNDSYPLPLLVSFTLDIWLQRHQYFSSSIIRHVAVALVNTIWWHRFGFPPRSSVLVS
jgi:hypothetical protein